MAIIDLFPAPSGSIDEIGQAGHSAVPVDLAGCVFVGTGPVQRRCLVSCCLPSAGLVYWHGGRLPAEECKFGRAAATFHVRGTAAVPGPVVHGGECSRCGAESPGL